MPVQINEVVIRAVVEPTPATNEPSQVQCGSEGNTDIQANDLAEQIIEILREKNER